MQTESCYEYFKRKHQVYFSDKFSFLPKILEGWKEDNVLQHIKYNYLGYIDYITIMH